MIDTLTQITNLSMFIAVALSAVITLPGMLYVLYTLYDELRNRKF